jgi:tol-pal system protein YbgF
MLGLNFLRGCCAIALLTSACTGGSPPPETSRTQLESQLTTAERRLMELSGQVAKLQAAVDNYQKKLQEIDATPAAERSQAQSAAAAERPRPAPATVENPPKIAASPAPEGSLRAAVPATPAETTPAGPEALYRQALEAYHAGAFDRATTLFDGFGRQHPRHPLADNALYWTGECHYARKRYLKAIDTFKSVLQRYPKGEKVPDAQLKTGYSYLALGDNTTGRRYLQQVVRQYPFSPAGAKAEERLKVIR